MCYVPGKGWGGSWGFKQRVGREVGVRQRGVGGWRSGGFLRACAGYRPRPPPPFLVPTCSLTTQPLPPASHPDPSSTDPPCLPPRSSLLVDVFGLGFRNTLLRLWTSTLDCAGIMQQDRDEGESAKVRRWV